MESLPNNRNNCDTKLKVSSRILLDVFAGMDK